jgi:hypothetical protein
VTYTEAVGNHVFLAQSSLRPVGPDAVAQGTEEACITGREIAAGAHYSKLAGGEQKHHEQNFVLDWYCPGIATAA